MPTYDYRCKNCKNEWELFQPITAKPVRKCPKCGKSAAERVIGPGAGIIFRGSGFYQTDYRSDSYKKAAEADKKSQDSGSAKSNGESKSSSESSGKKKKSEKSE